LTVSGPSARGAHDYLINVINNFLKQQNEPGERLLKIYQERLTRVRAEEQRIRKQLELYPTKFSNPDNVAQYLILMENSREKEVQANLNREILDLRKNILLIPLCNSRILSQPTIESEPSGLKPIKAVFLAIVLGLFSGIIVVFIVDSVDRFIKKNKT
jgi:uncharacterized protein involved in exopolysaccharide biosynthesis